MKGRIAEVFESVQGEGIYFGERQIFVRFFGCNLNCRYCDTKLNRFMEYQPQELFEEIKLYGNEFHSVSFTGGEPLLQKDFLKEVLELTRKEGYKNYLETNGTLAGELSEVVEFLDIVAMDIKMASSSGMGNLLGMHQRFLKAAGDKEIFLKIVVCLSSQESELIEAIRMLKETNRTAILVLQPNSYEDAGLISEKTKKFKEICFKEAVTVCVIPQMHKLIGVL